MTTPTPGIYHGIPMSEYLGWDAMNQSSLKTIIDTSKMPKWAGKDRARAALAKAGGAS